MIRARVLVAAGLVAGGLLSNPRWEPPLEAGYLAYTLLPPSDSQVCLMPGRAAYPAQTTRGGGAGGRFTDEEKRVIVNDWPPETVMGGEIMPIRTVFDPYPTFDAVAVDPEVGRAFFSDSSLSGLLSYDVTLGGFSDGITDATTHILGPDTGIGFIAGLEIDPKHREVYAVNNDGGGVVVFTYDQTGVVRPVRQLETPHQSWGISLSQARQEIAVSAQQLHGVVFYRRGASAMEPPLRSLRGYATRIADPHGVVFDDQRKELVIANHGNWTELRPYSPYDPLSKDPPSYQAGRFDPPSVTVFSSDAAGNTAPLRVIVGPKTLLNWPMGVEIDAQRDEIIVANYGDDSVRFYRRTADGDAAPVRTLEGDKTFIDGPVDVSVDVARNEIWIANYADHTAVVFDRDASGNVAPKRIIRNGPKGAPSLTFTNASAAAYDTKRDALIVPN